MSLCRRIKQKGVSRSRELGVRNMYLYYFGLGTLFFFLLCLAPLSAVID